MSKVTAPLPRKWRPGLRKLPVRQLNEPGALLRQIVGGVNPPRQIKPNAASSGPVVRRMQITEVLPDYLVCRHWDGTEQGEADQFVARPPRLRATEASRTFAGGTITYSDVNSTGTTRTATLEDASEEDQVVVPEYVVGDEIYATRNVKGGAGVSREIDGRTTELQWLDLNVDGRAWAKA